MNIHPEMQEGPLGELMRSMAGQETVKVKCQCGEEVIMNAAYAQYVKGPLESCSKCR